MKNVTKYNQKGAALLVYLLIMTFFVSILMTTTYSRLLLSLKRAEASTDALAANYRAESEVYDLIARLSGNFLTQNPLNIDDVKQDGNTKLTIKGTQNGNVQMLSISVDRPFASSKIVAERTVETLGSTQSLDIVLSLDCTQSMDSPADTTSPGGDTRFDALEEAATTFVKNISERSDRDKFHLGVSVFGIDARWLTTSNGVEIKPDANVPLSVISDAIETKFSSVRRNSRACDNILNSTSVGTPFAFSHEYFKTHKTTGVKQIEIVVTDGIPNSRIPYQSCSPSVFCPGAYLSYCSSNPYQWTCPSNASESTCTSYGIDFLRCSVADSQTQLPGNRGGGARDPQVSAYGVTILGKPANNEIASFNEVVNIFNTYLGSGNYFNASQASQLPAILDNIFKDIITKHETISVKKVTPGI